MGYLPSRPAPAKLKTVPHARDAVAAAPTGGARGLVLHILNVL